MKLAELEKAKGVLILGAGCEGLSTFGFLREVFREKKIGLADEKKIDQLDPEIRESFHSDPNIELHFGRFRPADLDAYDIIVKSPGVLPGLVTQVRKRKPQRGVTSATAIFFANCEGMIIGVTGTKGKSTTASIIHAILQEAGCQSFLVGNIGSPALDYLRYSSPEVCFVYELSSQQLEGLRQSPHVAVLLNIVKEHLDYHGNYREYIEAKASITRYQSGRDYLVYNAASPVARKIAEKSLARLLPFSVDRPISPGCFVSNGRVLYASQDGRVESVVRVEEVPLLGRFNLNNVLAAVAANKLLGIETEKIAAGIRGFRPLEHRFEMVGTFRGISFYNASIATVPEATIEHLETLGDDVQTLLLGGYDRQLDFSDLASRILSSEVRTLILFPTTGRKIWEAILSKRPGSKRLPRACFIRDMDEAVRLAYEWTEPGKICLHSPASPSFGIFKDYVERGRLFKQIVTQLGLSEERLRRG